MARAEFSRAFPCFPAPNSQLPGSLAAKLACQGGSMACQGGKVLLLAVFDCSDRGESALNGNNSS